MHDSKRPKTASGRNMHHIQPLQVLAKTTPGLLIRRTISVSSDGLYRTVLLLKYDYNYNLSSEIELVLNMNTP